MIEKKEEADLEVDHDLLIQKKPENDLTPTNILENSLGDKENKIPDLIKIDSNSYTYRIIIRCQICFFL